MRFVARAELCSRTIRSTESNSMRVHESILHGRVRANEGQTPVISWAIAARTRSLPWEPHYYLRSGLFDVCKRGRVAETIECEFQTLINSLHSLWIIVKLILLISFQGVDLWLEGGL